MIRLPTLSEKSSLLIPLLAGASLLGLAPVTVKALPFDAEVLHSIE